jgi:hypothetical protein
VPDWLATWLPAPVIAGIAFAFAPRVTAQRPPTDLSAFFSTAATIMGAFFIALALLSVASRLAAYTITRVAGIGTFVYLAVGVVAAGCGTIQAWPYLAYRYLFAIAVGTGAAALLTLTRIGITNLFSQVKMNTAALAQQLGTPPAAPGSGVPPAAPGSGVPPATP